MTARELQQSIGKLVYYRGGEIRFLCRVLDAKEEFGRVRLLITPIAGEGEQWREFSSLEPFQENHLTSGRGCDTISHDRNPKQTYPALNQSTAVQRIR